MIRILIIENNINRRLHYELVFKDRDYEVQIVQSELEALEILDSQKIDAVILDLKFRDDDGLQLMEDILSCYAHLPIFINWVDKESEDSFLFNTNNFEYFVDEKNKFLSLKENLDSIILTTQECIS